MRRIMTFNRVSADGYFAALDGNLNWVVPDEEIDRAGAAASPGFDTILFGRRTYEAFESFWPHVIPGTDAIDPHTPGRRSPAMLAMAGWINEATKIVFSKTRTTVSWNNSRIVRDVDPKEIDALKQQPGQGMIIFGSGTLVTELTRYDLIDEYQFVIGPVLLGAGRPLISGLPKTSKLELLESKAYPSGNIVVRYARAA